MISKVETKFYRSGEGISSPNLLYVLPNAHGVHMAKLKLKF